MYNEFAKLYDALQEIDYSEFMDYYQRIFERYDLCPQLILDLACGTGNITLPLAKRGYDMIGLDLSVEMLDIAKGKAEEAGADILFLNQDMTEFELYGTVDAIVCALDSVNYILDEDALSRMFRLVWNYLNPGGIMIFDINTSYKLCEVLKDHTFVYDEDGAYCVWNNYYDKEAEICCFDLNFFIRQDDGRYIRQDEYQEERAYSVSGLEDLVRGANLNLLGVFDAFTFDPPKEKSERVFFVIQKGV